MSEESQPAKKDYHNILDQVPEDYIKDGESIKAAYVGLTLHELSGQSTDEQSLSRGHFGGKAAGIISLFIYLQELINDLTVLKPEFIPVMKKTPRGKIWVRDHQEALQLGLQYGYKIVQKGEWIPKYGKNGEVIDEEFIQLPEEKDRYYYDYKGFFKRDTDIAAFAYNVARATGSFQGETKNLLTQALSNLKAVPVIPAQSILRPSPEMYGMDSKDKDAD